MKYRFLKSIALALFILALPAASWAQGRSIRSEFINNHIGKRFQQQAELVKKNGDIIPEEVKSLIADAMGADKIYEQKMHLLDIANAMASMHKYWNGDEKPLVEVETVLKMEIERERARVAELEKWTKYEKGLGNFVMKEHIVQLEAKGLAPVIFPHWMHRAIFQCKVCHQDIFMMKRGANDVDHNEEGKQCWACHNGKYAFGNDLCEGCHIAGRPEAESLYNVSKVDHKKIREAAGRVGAEWRPENLPDGKLPLDRFGSIDWIEIKRRGAFNPVGSLGSAEREDIKDEVRDNIILFEPTSNAVNDVLFSHKVHSSWIRCDTCHPAIFKDELGGNSIKMTDMASGKYCGHCHGKVSFTFADCLRCHKHQKGASAEGALSRHSK